MTQKSSNDLPVPSIEELSEALELGAPPRRQRRSSIVGSKESAYNDLLDLEAIRAEKANRHLINFISEAWHIVEPKNPFVSNWHIEAICEALEAVAVGQIKDLLINIPPRCTKSMISSVMFHPWCWAKWPELRFINASYSAGLSNDHANKARSVMMSRWYQKYYGHKFALTSDAVSEIKNDKTGYRITTSVGGMATGRGGDIIITDDPHNVKEAHSDAKREGVISWWDNSMSNRAEGDPKKLRRIIIMQRVHDKDLSGHVLKQGGYVHLCLPMEYEPKQQCIVPELDFKDPRSEKNELLNKHRFDLEWVDKQKGENRSGKNPKLVRKMDSWSYAGQYQQNPVPLEGGMAKREWFKQAFYRDDPMEIYKRASTIFMSWDMSFKDELEASNADPSYVVGTIWGKIRSDLYLIDMFRAQIGFNDTLKAFVKMCRQYPRAQEKLIEDKANGIAIMNTLRRKINGIIAAETNNDPKEVRYGSVLWLIEAGNVRLPDPEKFREQYPWIEVALNELCRFPKGATDDIVDSVTHALVRYAAMFIDPDIFPIGVGEGGRFENQWSPDDTYTISRDITSSWGVDRE